MKYYCPNCMREYEDSGFKYCPLCVVKLKEKPLENIDSSNELNQKDEISAYIENDEEINKKQEEIDSQKQLIKELEEKLHNQITEDDIIEYRYQIMKKEERLEVLNQELNNLIETKKKIKKQEIFDKQREKLFKIIYVTITDENINEFLNNEIFGYSTKEEIVNAATDIGFSKNLKKGMEFHSKENYKTALKYLNLAINECKSDVVWYFKAHCHFLLKEYDDALMSINRSLDINPSSNFAIYLKLEIYLIQEKFDEGLKYCNRLLKVHKNNFLIWHYKGKLLFKKHNFQEALKYLDNALDLKPDDALSWYLKSVCYANLNQLDDAIKCNKKALSLEPDNEEFIRISKILDERNNV